MVQNISSLHYVNDLQSNVQSTTVLNTDISKLRKQKTRKNWIGGLDQMNGSKRFKNKHSSFQCKHSQICPLKLDIDYNNIKCIDLNN